LWITPPDYLFDLAELEKPYWRRRLGTVLVKITCFVKQYFYAKSSNTVYYKVNRTEPSPSVGTTLPKRITKIMPGAKVGRFNGNL
jgi:hypothetical protein